MMPNDLGYLMNITVADICFELREKYNVDEFFYPNISMDMEIPNGFEGEVSEIVKALTSYGYEISVANVFQVMALKKELFLKYTGSEKGKELLASYRDLLVTKVKPVGTTIPTDLIFINGLVLILLSVIARFGLSLADEAGKIVARKLLDNEEKQAKKHNMNVDEYRFVKNEVVIWIEERNAVISLIQKMQKRKR